MSRWTGPAIVGGGGGNRMGWIGEDERLRGLLALWESVFIISGVGLGSLCCRRCSSGLFHLLGWLPIWSEDLTAGPLPDRSY